MILVLGTVLFSIQVLGTASQLTYAGTCPNIQAMSNFDFRRYQDVWYEVEKYFFLPEIVGTCVYVRYKNFQETDSSFEADIWQTEAITRKQILTPCKGRVVGPDGTAQIDLRVTVNIPFSIISMKVDYPYYILDTDYETYSIKWACRQIGAYNAQSIWILTKTGKYPNDIRDLVHEKLRGFGLQPEYLKLTDQTNCPAPRK